METRLKKTIFWACILIPALIYGNYLITQITIYDKVECTITEVNRSSYLSSYDKIVVKDDEGKEYNLDTYRLKGNSHDYAVGQSNEFRRKFDDYGPQGIFVVFAWIADVALIVFLFVATYFAFVYNRNIIMEIYKSI